MKLIKPLLFTMLFLINCIMLNVFYVNSLETKQLLAAVKLEQAKTALFEDEIFELQSYNLKLKTKLKANDKVSSFLTSEVGKNRATSEVALNRVYYIQSKINKNLIDLDHINEVLKQRKTRISILESDYNNLLKRIKILELSKT